MRKVFAILSLVIAAQTVAAQGQIAAIDQTEFKIKPIIIGKGGTALKRLGTAARKEIEAFFGKKIYLEIFVKVCKDWRDNAGRLRGFGYDL